MVKIPLLVTSAALAASLTGCAGYVPGAGTDALSASPTSEAPSVAGHWQGSLWESHAPPIYTGTIGPDQGSGVARRHSQRLLLTGTIRRAGGHEEPVYLDLVGDDSRRWSETHAFFGDRESPASASLRKVL
jgi:hypothetical protein